MKTAPKLSISVAFKMVSTSPVVEFESNHTKRKYTVSANNHTAAKFNSLHISIPNMSTSIYMLLFIVSMLCFGGSLNLDKAEARVYQMSDHYNCPDNHRPDVYFLMSSRPICDGDYHPSLDNS